MRAILAASIIAALSAPASAAPPPPTDGVYGCTLDGQAVGFIKIEGDRYFPPSREKSFGDPAKFIMLDPDRIFWLGEMGDLSAAGYRVDHTVSRAGAFDIVLLKPDQSGYVTATCAPSA